MSLDITAWSGIFGRMWRSCLSARCVDIQGEFAMLCFGATRDVDEAKSRLENLTEIVRQSGTLFPFATG